MPATSVRRVDRADRAGADAVRRLMGEYIDLSIAEIDPPLGEREEAQLRERLEHARRNLFKAFEAVFLAEADGRPAGCGALSRHDDDTAVLERVYVEGRARRRGLGRALTEAAAAEAEALGYRRLVLDVLPTRRAAVALYEALGFDHVEPWREMPMPMVYMARRLG